MFNKEEEFVYALPPFLRPMGRWLWRVAVLGLSRGEAMRQAAWEFQRHGHYKITDFAEMEASISKALDEARPWGALPAGHLAGLWGVSSRTMQTWAQNLPVIRRGRLILLHPWDVFREYGAPGPRRRGPRKKTR